MAINEFQQIIGEPVANFTAGELPNIIELTGEVCVLQPLSQFDDLDAVAACYFNFQPMDWTYIPLDPMPSLAHAKALAEEFAQSTDPYHLVILNKATREVLGTFSLMRADTQNRVIEMGWVMYGDKLKRSRIGTEAQFLAMRYVFDVLKYRRYEWKCDSLNQRSFKAAQRLGFKHEGIFRNLLVYKNRNRDTAWFSIIREEWQGLKAKFTTYLANDNFDENGKQIKALGEC